MSFVGGRSVVCLGLLGCSTLVICLDRERRDVLERSILSSTTEL